MNGRALTRAQLDEYKRLRALTAELVEVSERLCHARLAAERESGQEVNKGGFAETVAAEISGEVDRLIGAGSADRIWDTGGGGALALPRDDRHGNTGESVHDGGGPTAQRAIACAFGS